MNPPPSSLLRVVESDDWTDVQRREKEFDENPLRHKSIHFSEGAKEGDNRALHFTGTKWRENVGGEWKNHRAVSERDHAAARRTVQNLLVTRGTFGI